MAFMLVKFSGVFLPLFYAFSAAFVLFRALSVPADVRAESQPVRFLQAVATDDGSLTSSAYTLSIDVAQNLNCNPASGLQISEPFGSTILVLKLKNDLPYDVTFKKFSAKIKIRRKVMASRPRALTGIGTIEGNSIGTIQALLLFAQGGQKFLLGNGVPIPTTLGARTVSLLLTGSSSSGKPVHIRGRITLSFGDYNRCVN